MADEKNAGCDLCGIHDRSEGSLWCAGCADENSDPGPTRNSSGAAGFSFTVSIDGPAKGDKVRFPSIKDVAFELRLINANVEGECDVRLQIHDDGAWVVRVGLADYDTDHRGYWGAGSIPGVVRGDVKRFNSTDTARDLLSQCREALI